MQKAATCLPPSELLFFKCVAYAYMGLCARVWGVCIIAENQPSESLNLKFRLWLLRELIYMPLMSPPRCAFRPEAERTSLFQSLEKLQAQKAFQYFNATRCEEQKTQTDACRLRLSYNCHRFFLKHKRIYSAFQL